MTDRSGRWLVWLAFVSSLAAGCGGGGGAVDGGSSADAASGADGGNGVDDGGAVGTCSLTLVDGGVRSLWQGFARARMNGSGNLTVRCEAVLGDSSFDLAIGNATFDGPRTYRMDDFTSDGSIQYDTGGTGDTYSSSDTGGSCVLELVEAVPLDARGDSVRVGGHVSGGFGCLALTNGSSGASPSSYGVEAGSFTATVE